MKTGMENGMFWSEIGSGFGEPGGTPPSRNPRSTPPGGGGGGGGGLGLGRRVVSFILLHIASLHQGV